MSCCAGRLLYLVYSLIRGPIADWYPYPFLDPRISGYGTVAVMALAIAAAAFVLALITAFSTRLHIAPTSDRVTAGAATAPLEPEGGTVN